MRVKHTFYVAAFLLAILLPGCNLDRHEEIETIKTEYYLIDPQTIVESIEKGNEAVFTLSSSEPTSMPLDQQKSVNWKSDDYLYITAAFFEYVWGDSLNDWQMNRVHFKLSCEDISTGLQESMTTFFKDIETTEGEVRLVRDIHIYPKRNYIYVWERMYTPKLVNWTAIDLEKLTISAESALEIAEYKGGQDKRFQVNNHCSIDLSLVPDSASYKGWRVYYRSFDNAKPDLLQMEIDPVTGVIK